MSYNEIISTVADDENMYVIFDLKNVTYICS